MVHVRYCAYAVVAHITPRCNALEPQMRQPQHPAQSQDQYGARADPESSIPSQSGVAVRTVNIGQSGTVLRIDPFRIQTGIPIGARRRQRGSGRQKRFAWSLTVATLPVRRLCERRPVVSDDPGTCSAGNWTLTTVSSQTVSVTSSRPIAPVIAGARMMRPSGSSVRFGDGRESRRQMISSPETGPPSDRPGNKGRFLL